MPGEKSEAHTTEVALQVPKGLLPFAYEDQPGWRRTLERADDGSVGVIRWRGRLATDGFVRFTFLAGTPEQEGDLVWKAVQRYDDGHEAAWIGAPDSENPAPVTRVTASAARQNAGGEGAEAEAPRGRRRAGLGSRGRRRRRRRRRARSVSSLGGAGLVLGAAALVVALRRAAEDRGMRRAVALAFALAALLAAPALAHEGNPNYLSEVDAITPAADGVTVEVLNRDDRLLLHNTSGEDVVVLGYDDEPYARVLADGTVQVNTNSEAYYLNDDRFANATVPKGLRHDARLEGGRQDRAVRVARPPHALDVEDDAAAGDRRGRADEDLRLPDPARGRRPPRRDRRHAVLDAAARRGAAARGDLRRRRGS